MFNFDETFPYNARRRREKKGVEKREIDRKIERDSKKAREIGTAEKEKYVSNNKRAIKSHIEQPCCDNNQGKFHLFQE